MEGPQSERSERKRRFTSKWNGQENSAILNQSERSWLKVDGNFTQRLTVENKCESERNGRSN